MKESDTVSEEAAETVTEPATVENEKNMNTVKESTEAVTKPEASHNKKEEEKKPQSKKQQGGNRQKKSKSTLDENEQSGGNESPDNQKPAEQPKETKNESASEQQAKPEENSKPEEKPKPEPQPAAYSPDRVVSLAISKCRAGGMVTTEQHLQDNLNAGKITREEYKEYYPLDGLEDSFYSVFVNIDLNKAETTSGRRLGSEEAIAQYIADMLLLESDTVFHIRCVGTAKTSGETFYEFRCYR